MDLLTKYRSRKWLLTVAVLLIATALSVFGKLSAELTQIITALIVSYNGAQGIVDAVRARNGTD